MITFDEYVRKGSEMCPDLWKVFYPRVYEHTGAYGSCKLPAIISPMQPMFLYEIQHSLPISL